MRHRKFSTLQREIETLKGKWKLSPNHELTYKTRSKGKGPRSQQATLKASIVAAEPEALVIAVTTKQDSHRTVTGSVKLSGKWQLDSKNRITFFVKRGSRKQDKLTFQGMWEVNKRNEIVYTYTSPQWPGTASSRARRSGASRLTFRGKWDISGKHCLTYALAGSSRSIFRVRGTFQTKNIIAKKGEIRYQAGIEYKTNRGNLKRIKRTITLFGKWKLSRNFTLTFEIQYAGHRKSQLRFGTQLRRPGFRSNHPLLKPGLRRVLPDTISVDLIAKNGRPLGIEVVLTKEFFKNAQGFARFLRSAKETKGELGITIPW